MADKVHELRPRVPEAEKITINLGHVDLGRIDLLVREGFYSNRTDFIRMAIRERLDRHDGEVRRSVERQSLDLGLRTYARADLEALREAGETLRIQVVGLAVIAGDVSPELARATIASIHVLGTLSAPAAVKAALADRIR
jgi:Arc/MetJ-type ribon-helix-helix transcriptional regulator